MRLHPQSSSALDPRVHSSRKTPVEIVVEQLRELVTVEPILSLKHVFLTEGVDGQQIMTRRDMRAALNFCLPRPRQLHDDEYQILVNFLDPDQTNFVNVQDFINLFPKKPLCQCYPMLDICPGVVQSYSGTSALKALQSESQKTILPKCDIVAKPCDGKCRIPLGPCQNVRPDGTKPCEISGADIKLKVLDKTAELISAVNRAQNDDGLDFFGKNMVATLRKLDTVAQEEAKLEIQQTVYRFLRRI